MAATWTDVVGTLGAGWGVPLTLLLELPPIANFSVGPMSRDAGPFGLLLAYRLGGSPMLDHEGDDPRREIDLELRCSAMPEPPVRRLRTVEDIPATCA